MPPDGPTGHGCDMAVFSGKFARAVFIVSSGRTGTMALARHLDACYEQVWAAHEPRPSWRLRRASSRALCGRLSREELARLLADNRRRLVAGIGAVYYIESNPFLGGFLDVFGDVFENAAVVHVVRDPRTYIRSGMNFGTFRGIKGLAVRLIPWWLPRPELMPGSGGLRWSEMSPPVRLAWYWAMLNRHLNRGQTLYGDNYLRIRFEDLFARDGSGLKQLAAWIGLPWDERLVQCANSEKVNASRDAGFPRFADWSDSLKRQVMDHCGELMELYGYN